MVHNILICSIRFIRVIREKNKRDRQSTYSFPRMARMGTDKNTVRVKQETRKPGFFYGFLASPLEAFYFSLFLH
jgi:hypothetical protein